MAHVQHSRKRLLARVNRIQGQVAALATALDAGTDCSQVLVQIAAVRGAVHGLMMEVLRDHLRSHVAAQPDEATRTKEIEVVAELLRVYLK
ncbi:MAG: metal/formaldehyde-sensitive transcriptional repressor [Lysobacter sp.]|nr:metal/formaldehyde-sensitive transcriptional repressor [Lysobacter sp.]